MKRQTSYAPQPGPAKIFSLFIPVFFVLAAVSWGVPANPVPFETVQPDGQKIKISLKGDEFYKWHEDVKGYTVLQDQATRDWLYAEKDAGGAIKAGKYKVGAHDPERLQLPKRLIDSERSAFARKRRAARNSSAAYQVSGARAVAGLKPSLAASQAPILTGTMKNLVILARFSDQSATYSQAQFSSLFNDIGYSYDGAMGSVKDYFLQVSYNKLNVESIVTAWVTLPEAEVYYGQNDLYGYDKRPEQMAADAINALHTQYPAFNFATVDGNGDGLIDNLTIIHSGRGEELSLSSPNRIWSHQSVLPAPITINGVTMSVYHTEPEFRGDTTAGITRIGVICHETGHFLGLPDLYDTTYYGSAYTSSGIGEFCLMAAGSWNGPGDEGASPAHISAWCKKYLGWAAPTQLTTSGVKSLQRIQDHSTALYMLHSGGFSATQYFLVENRQGYGFDAYLPGSTRGILIWHIDESMLNNDYAPQYMVDLEEASGTQHLQAADGVAGDDADYFRAGNNASFTDTTSPNSKSYSGYNLNLPISSISASGSTMTFYLEAPPDTVQRELGALSAYPNPCDFRVNRRVYFAPAALYSFPSDAAGVRVYIYNEAGELVRELSPGDGINGLNTASWDGLHKNGSRAASGLYVYLVKTSNYGKGTGKFFIVW